MIVVDSNVLAYFLISGPHSTDADAVYSRDSRWVSPLLWKSELRDVVLVYLRMGKLTLEESVDYMARAESLMHGAEYSIESARVLALASASGCSAYDCEFVALAEMLNLKLVTEDRAVLRSFPGRAVSMKSFVNEES